MNALLQSITQIFTRAMGAVKTNTAAIGFALAFATVTLIRIQLDWPEQEAYNFLFNCLHWSFALGAIFSLAALTAAKSRFDTPKANLLANLISIVVVMVTFGALYLMGGTQMDQAYSRYQVLTHLAIARISVAIFVSIIAFILFAREKKETSGFSRALFMTQKAFLIAALYGLVMMSGSSAVAGAIQNLLYNDMSEKVYMTLATLSGFMAFTIFVGYFPSFKKDFLDPRLEAVQKQPQFIEALLGFILVPLFLALTVVLLLWAMRTVLTDKWPIFTELASIASAFALGGVWLHMMVIQHKTRLANFFKTVYPAAALIILAFEAQALWHQLARFGLKTVEYEFILVWIIAVAAAILLLIFKARAHVMVALLVCAVGIFSVLPLVSYQALPVMAQVNRLENLLVSAGILVNGQLLPADPQHGPNEDARVAITDAVVFLSNAEKPKLPQWYAPRLGEADIFKSKLGFDQTWSKDPDYRLNRSYLGLSLILPSTVIDIGDYQWLIPITEQYRGYGESVTLETSKGLYKFYWKSENFTSAPSLKITLDDQPILEETFDQYVDQLMDRYPLNQNTGTKGTLADLTYGFENQHIAILMVFNTVNINVDPQNDNINYYLNLNGIYLREKP